MNIFQAVLCNWYTLDVKFNYVLFIGIISIILLIRFFIKHKAQDFEIDSAEFGFGANKLVIKENSLDYQIAYMIWIELSTRKLGIMIDKEHDVVHEIYDSWYNFFEITRELLKEIPVSKINRSDTTYKLIELSFEVLNDIIRPHLTVWQAKYRKWYKNNENNYENLTPQETQKKYPEYNKLLKEMELVNKQLINYRNLMYGIIRRGR